MSAPRYAELLLAPWRQQARALAWRRKRIQGCWWRWRSFNSTKVKRGAGWVRMGVGLSSGRGRLVVWRRVGEGRARVGRAGSEAWVGQGQGLGWLPENPCLLQDIITMIISKYCLCGQKEKGAQVT